MAKRKKKQKIKRDRVIVIFILFMALLFGGYQTIKSLIDLVGGNNEFIKVVNGPVIGTVILDAGHGGSDSGCIGDNVYEKDINLRYVREIGNYLMKHGVQVYYTRTDDSRLAEEQNADLKARCNMGIKKNADYYISIHVNSHDSHANVSGFEVYYDSYNKSSFTLAKNVSDNMEKLNYSKNRGVLEGNSLYVIRNNTVVPILVELGYMNSDDKSYLLSNRKTVKLSEEIAEGIIKTIQNK